MKYFLSFLLFLGVFPLSFSQSKLLIPLQNGDKIYAEYMESHEGYLLLVLASGDTLKVEDERLPELFKSKRENKKSSTRRSSHYPTLKGGHFFSMKMNLNSGGENYFPSFLAISPTYSYRYRLSPGLVVFGATGLKVLDWQLGKVFIPLGLGIEHGLGKNPFSLAYKVEYSLGNKGLSKVVSNRDLISLQEVKGGLGGDVSFNFRKELANNRQLCLGLGINAQYGTLGYYILNDNYIFKEEVGTYYRLQFKLGYFL